MKMRIFDGKIYRDMTAKEVEQWQQSMSEAPAPEPTTEERVAALEEELKAERKNREFLEDCIAEMAIMVYGGDS